MKAFDELQVVQHGSAAVVVQARLDFRQAELHQLLGGLLVRPLRFSAGHISFGSRCRLSPPGQRFQQVTTASLRAAKAARQSARHHTISEGSPFTTI
jgi:hypothetical protein